MRALRSAVKSMLGSLNFAKDVAGGKEWLEVVHIVLRRP